jgi:hypothetical protein
MTPQLNFLTVLVCCQLIPVVSGAELLPNPKGVVVLEVVGAIHQKTSGQETHFDLEMLDGLPQISFRSTTVWTEGLFTFSGPSLTSVLEFVNAGEGGITVSAANNYSIELLANTGDPDFPILATRMNGALLSLRNFGPIWLVYPYDSSADYRNDLIYSQSVWQVTHITATEE